MAAKNKPARFNPTMREGDDYTLGVTFAFPIVGYTAFKSQIRPGPAPAKPVVDFAVGVPDTVTNRVAFDLTGEQITAAMDGWEYDVQCVTPAGKRKTFLEGEITVEPQITT